MVAAHGFEPRTHRVWTDCSSQLSYAAMYGASDRDWTGDLILTKDTLCRLSYTSTMNDHFTVVFMVAGTGLEPATFGLWARRATNCSTPRWKWWREKDSNLRSRRRQIYSLLPLAARESLQKNGAGDRNWTHNLLITSQLLYLLSYASIITTRWIVSSATLSVKNFLKTFLKLFFVHCGIP